MNITEARDHLADLVRTIDGVRVYTDLLGNLDPPCVMVNVPSLSWDSMFSGPTEAVFTVVYAVKFSDRAAESLIDAVALMSEALDDTDVLIVSAEPTVLSSGGVDLPGYSFTVSIALGG